MVKRIILFGAGSFGKKALDFYQTQANIEVIAFCDNNPSLHQSEISGFKVISPQQLMDFDFDEIIICSSFDDEILTQLSRLGFTDEKISLFHSNQDKIHLNKGNKLLMAEHLMLALSNLFNEQNIQYHIDHGTLLGITRDQKLLPWDIDVDFALLIEEKEKVIEALESFVPNYQCPYIQANQWRFTLYQQKMKLGDNEFNRDMIIQVYNDVPDKVSELFTLDLEFKHLYKNRLYWMVGSRRLSCARETCFPTRIKKYKNKKIRVPDRTDLYLQNLYGDWRKPVKQWYYNSYENIS